MTTVGYGDISPKTNFGQFVAIVAGLTGIMLASLLVAAVTSQLELSPGEMASCKFGMAQKLRHAERLLAARVLQAWWRISLKRRRSVTRSQSERSRLMTGGGLRPELLDYSHEAKLHIALGKFAQLQQVKLIELGDDASKRGDKDEHRSDAVRGVVVRRLDALETSVGARLSAVESQQEALLACMRQLLDAQGVRGPPDAMAATLQT